MGFTDVISRRCPLARRLAPGTVRTYRNGKCLLTFADVDRLGRPDYMLVAYDATLRQIRLTAFRPGMEGTPYRLSARLRYPGVLAVMVGKALNALGIVDDERAHTAWTLTHHEDGDVRYVLLTAGGDRPCQGSGKEYNKCALCDNAVSGGLRLCLVCNNDRLLAASGARILSGGGLTYSNSNAFCEERWIEKMAPRGDGAAPDVRGSELQG